MEAVTNFKLPWRLLREKLAVVTANNEIAYENTLQMIESDDIVSSTIFFEQNISTENISNRKSTLMAPKTSLTQCTPIVRIWKPFSE